jgi:murein DD-endopeptidase MepM/ murein hydrolase activator NlpD
MEEQGSIRYWSVLFKAKSFSDFLDRMKMVREIEAADRKRIQELCQAAEMVENTKKRLQSEKDGLEKIQLEQQQTIERLNEQQKKAEQLLDRLVDKGAEYEALIQKSEDLQEQLAMEIAQAEKDYDAAKYREWLATSVPPTTAPPPTTKPTAPPTKPTEAPTKPTEAPTKPTEAPTKPTEAPTKPTEAPTEPTEAPTVPTEPPVEPEIPAEPWRSPLLRSTYVTSAYGWRMHPIHNEMRMHHGVDLYSKQGDTIVAVRSGIVTVAAYQAGGAGYYVTINHGDGFSSTYMHMTHFIVAKGDIVTQGQTIGYVGSTGVSTGPHLHFGIYKDGKSVNPVEYVKFN